jgi:hypothetical protein
MHRREFLKSVLIVPAAVGATAGAPFALAKADAKARTSDELPLAYGSADRAWMVAADRTARPPAGVSPLLCMPGRQFANHLMTLSVLTSAADAKPYSIIAPADFTGADAEPAAISALAGFVGDQPVTTTDVAAWIGETAMQDIWAEIVRPFGWYPLPIGVLPPCDHACVTDAETSENFFASGLTRRSLEADDLFAIAEPRGTIIGADAAGLVSSFGAAGAAMRVDRWRRVATPGLTATGAIVGAFFDLDWWTAQDIETRHAIKLAADTTLNWHLRQNRMAEHLLAHALLPDTQGSRADDPGSITARLRVCAEACKTDIGASPAAAAMIGPLMELGRGNRPRYPFA